MYEKESFAWLKSPKFKRLKLKILLQGKWKRPQNGLSTSQTREILGQKEEHRRGWPWSSLIYPPPQDVLIDKPKKKAKKFCIIVLFSFVLLYHSSVKPNFITPHFSVIQVLSFLHTSSIHFPKSLKPFLQDSLASVLHNNFSQLQLLSSEPLSKGAYH